MTMSTQLFFNSAVDRMGTQQGRVNELQTQIATGKQVVKPSDAPDQATVISRLRSAVNRQEGFDRALTAIENRLTAEETALDSMQSSLIRIQELAIQGANDTNGPQDREALATEIEGLVDHMMGLANTQDVSGNYVFAGSDSKTRPYERIDGDIVYQGDDVTSQIFVSEQQMLNLNRPGSKMFPPIAHATDAGDDNKRSFFGALGDLVSSMRGNDYDGIHQGMSDVTDMIDAVSKSLATVGTDLTVVESRKEVLNDVKLRYQTLLSDAQDLDYSKAITDLSAEMLTLEAAQSAFAKISGQSLFDYIR